MADSADGEPDDGCIDALIADRFWYDRTGIERVMDVSSETDVADHPPVHGAS